ncbi:MAG: BlaI/MecI/CopY family transcriptional regulator [Prevotellaceae bacterium]|jgi:predicted transcriptional regulator|nr:BlaI/MecI/CopY family transcriptional regulator [Prevotellaceae bacterium]
MDTKLKKLTIQEQEAMLAIWKTGKGVVRDFLQNHPEPIPHYNTLVSTIKNLEKKSYVAHRVIGNVNEYFPIIEESYYKKQFMKTVVNNYFSSSYKELVAFFAGEKQISAKDLQEIIDMIEKQEDE